VTAQESHDVGAGFDALWSQLLPIGRTPATGGYRRFAWTAADAEAREWFTSAARGRGLDVHRDRNGNLWAWWLPERQFGEPVDAFVTGSHLDSVPNGGAFDGPLGVVAALCAIDVLRAGGARPSKPIAVVVFADEEGARFGVACAGSRLATGALDPSRAGALTDADGISLAAAMTQAGVDPNHLGRDDESLARIGAFVELHIEQGPALVELEAFDARVGIATAIWPHGRWRYSFIGEANHAGTTKLVDRRDPMLPFAAMTLAARDEAATHGGVATVGRASVEPNATNAVPSRVTGWLDARAPDQVALEAITAGVERQARQAATDGRVGFEVDAESVSGVVDFPRQLRDFMHKAIGPVPELATGAGHDAGVLCAEVASGMLFVRNPSGVSHAPEEFADRADCLAGVHALAAVMRAWSCP
jgi:N-carbamoyl-L-amino-acid hydrolase